MAETARPFIILFRGREGSSPLITQLSSHPEISVPLFEELDHFNASLSHPGVAASALVDETLTQGAFPRAPGQAPLAALAGQAPKAARSIGFKWRIWGPADPLCAVLLRHRVQVFHLFRRNILETAASLYFSKHVLPGLSTAREYGLAAAEHPQFQFRQLAPADQAAVLARMAAQRFTLPRDYVMQRLATSLASKTEVEQRYARVFAGAGLSVRHLFYEDYLADPVGLLRRICACIGCDPGLAEQTVPTFGAQPPFRKASNPGLLDQVDNLEALRRDSEVMQRLAEFDRLCGSRPGVAP